MLIVLPDSLGDVQNILPDAAVLGNCEHPAGRYSPVRNWVAHLEESSVELAIILSAVIGIAACIIGIYATLRGDKGD
jgi:hypothetical protein